MGNNYRIVAILTDDDGEDQFVTKQFPTYKEAAGFGEHLEDIYDDVRWMIMHL